MTSRQDIVDDFWNDLGNQQKFYTEPAVGQNNVTMEVDKLFIFDEVFWNVFNTYPFRLVATSAGQDNRTIGFVVEDDESDGTTLSSYVGDDE